MTTYNPQLHDKAVIVQLSCSFSWGTVTDKQITEETNQSKGAVANAMHVRKKLLPNGSGALVKAVQSNLSEFYSYHTKHTFSTMTDGQRLMPTAFHLDYMREFNNTEAKAQSALDDLVQGYDEAVRTAKGLLNSSFNPDDYPPAEEIRRYYKFKHQFLPVPSGDAMLGALGAAVAADVDGYVEQIVQSASADAKTRLKDAVILMQERCANPKAKIYDTMVGAIDELVETLPAIAGLAMDPELQMMLDAVRQNLTGFDAKGLRESPRMRTNAAKAAADIMRRMSGG